MTVAIGNELSIDISPASNAGNPGSSGSAGSLLPGAVHHSGRTAGNMEGGSGSASAESFRARWQSELAAIRSAHESDDGGEQSIAENADAAAGFQKKSSGLSGSVGVNVPVSTQEADANGSLSATGARHPQRNSAIRDSETDGREDASSSTGSAGNTESAESPESKGTQNIREARKKDDARGQAKADSQKDAASLQLMNGTAMETVPLAVSQQQITVPAISAVAGASSRTGALGTSSVVKTAGNTDKGMTVGSGSPANLHPGRAVQLFGGLTPGGVSAAGGENLAEDGVHATVTGDHAEGPRDESLPGSAVGDGGRGLALPATTAQGTHEAGASAQGAAGSVAGAQGDTSQSNVAASSNIAADPSHETVSASRPGRSSNAGPNVGQNPGQIPVQGVGAGSATKEHEGGMAIMAAAGAMHGMPAQPAGAAAGTPGSVSGNSSEKGAGETFAAMDAQANGAGLTWVHVGPHQAEAGFQDPALGWVAVRAEMGAGGVHAAIVPGTADAAQTLGGHMAGLSAHLAEQRVGVSSISMNNPGNNPGLTPQLAGGGAGQNGGQQQGAGTGQNQGQHQPAGGSYALPAVTATSAMRGTTRVDSGAPAVAAANGMRGRHISVVA